MPATAKARGYADGYAHGWAAGSGVAAERSEHESQEQSAQAESARLVLTHRVERAIDVLAEAASAAGQRTVPVLAESAQLLIKGAIPGRNGGLVVVRTAIKRGEK